MFVSISLSLLFATQMVAFAQKVLDTVDLNQCTSYSPLKNPNVFTLSFVPQFQTNALTLYIPSTWWGKKTGGLPVFKDKSQIFSSELDHCFVITNGGEDDFFDTLRNINKKVSEWTFVRCNEGVGQNFYGFLHENKKTFVGLGEYSRLSSFLPRSDLFVPCVRGKLFFESIKTHQLQLPCRVELVCALIRTCSQEEKSQEKLANAIGSSAVELLNIRQPGHGQLLSGTTIAKAWMWLRNTPISEISEKFGVNTLAFMNILSSYRIETVDEIDESTESSVSTETSSIAEQELTPVNKLNAYAQKILAS